MPTLLHIDSSADLSHSRSRALTAAFADAWRARGPEYTVVRRDLHVDQLPHLETSALHWAAADRTADESVAPEAEALRQEVIDELLAADVVVVGSPLYNYTVPSTLKAWIDRIHIPGVLAGDVQPLAGRPVVTVVSRGATYDAGTPTEDWDHGSPVLHLILGTALGMKLYPITVSATLADRLPDLAPLAEHASAELADAKTTIERLATTLG
ncbi:MULTISPECIES: NAD(P)H-dependent oxidoreductase [unclassified Curtobacterium]|uniref:FMN-dependent NADH-azoreductase n=1 Tax=unclassified Curtobacterium TaxID=257496 RepID=UPI000DA70590|nr:MULTISPECIES: NAD(P)H-dependent oxidoreductase [unclassified Curtobacterium]RPE75603.1 FMN-dependent NADH-azoreductase [Curtobacterium sp. PhB137]TCU86013.1 FMN-dependent NADH-azoreductase [Curtobacterium sp. PhB191]WIE73575.1 NAD(P)H-dependent oxidoreductase [Curtobacterium sp. MCJR17_020]